MPRRSPLLLSPLSLLPFLAVAGACGSEDAVEADPALIETGVSRELALHRSATLSDLRYRYHLRVPRSGDVPLTGCMVARFRWEDPETRPLVMDFQRAGERVRSVRLNGDSVTFRTTEDHLVLPGEELADGAETVVAVDFEAGDGSLNRHEDFLYTLFVPDRARFAVPIFDQPDLKARYHLGLDVPRGWTAVANAPRAEDGEAGGGELSGDGGTGCPATESAPEGHERVRFAGTESIPTYLFAFVVGDFQVETARRGGRTLRMYHRETDPEKVARNREAIFDLHHTALEWLEEYTGVPYPFQKFDFVLIPSFQYGGMEHPGQILYNASGLLLDASATQSQHLGRASVIAHETAHMWFGDLVTMRWFDDVWTKEVFANFMAAKIVHPSFPGIDHDLRFFLAHHPAAYAVDRTAGANPIRQPLDNLDEAGTLYGPIIYQKAPIVMRQLERLVGEEAFREGMAEYLETYAYDNATWLDLIRILDERTPHDLAAWSRVWVEEPGRPLVSVETERDSGTVRRMVALQADPAGEGRVWPQPLTVALGYADTVVRLPARLGPDGAPVEGAAGRPVPAWVLPGTDGLGYGHVHLDPESREALLGILPRLARPLDRGTGYVVLHDAVLEGEVSSSPWMDLLLEGVRTEPDEQNLQRVLGYLGEAFWSLLTPEERARRAPEVEAALEEGMAGAADETRRAAYFRGWRDVVLTERGVERLRGIWSGQKRIPGLELSESDHIDLARELAVRGVEGADSILARQEERIENPDRKARFRFVRPALSADPAEREAFFERLGDPSAREREPWVLEGLAALHHPLRAEHGLRFVRPALEMLPEIQRTGDIFFPQRWLATTLGGHSGAAAADTVRAFLDGLADDYPRRLRGKLLQSADPLFRAARIGGGWEGEARLGHDMPDTAARGSGNGRGDGSP